VNSRSTRTSQLSSALKKSLGSARDIPAHFRSPAAFPPAHRHRRAVRHIAKTARIGRTPEKRTPRRQSADATRRGHPSREPGTMTASARARPAETGLAQRPLRGEGFASKSDGRHHEQRIDVSRPMPDAGIRRRGSSHRRVEARHNTASPAPARYTRFAQDDDPAHRGRQAGEHLRGSSPESPDRGRARFFAIADHHDVFWACASAVYPAAQDPRDVRPDAGAVGAKSPSRSAFFAAGPPTTEGCPTLMTGPRQANPASPGKSRVPDRGGAP